MEKCIGFVQIFFSKNNIAYTVVLNFTLTFSLEAVIHTSHNSHTQIISQTM